MSIPATERAALAAKLSPRAVKVSPKFTAILGALLGEHWTEPALAELSFTSDGHFLGRREGDCGFNDYLGTTADLRRNLNGVADTVELTPDERAALLALVTS